MQGATTWEGYAEIQHTAFIMNILRDLEAVSSYYPSVKTNS